MNSSDDNLISAYLDGELDAQERARAEQLLASSAEARQLLEELRALRVSLQDLPQHRLEIDFAQRVLQRAEQQAAQSPTTEAAAIAAPAMPTAAASEAAGPKSSPATHDSSAAEHAPVVARRLPINRRGLVWSLVAVAGALVIMVANRQSDQNRQAAEPAGELAHQPAAVQAPTPPEQQLPENKRAEERSTGSVTAGGGGTAPPTDQVAIDRTRYGYSVAPGVQSVDGSNLGIVNQPADKSASNISAGTLGTGNVAATGNAAPGSAAAVKNATSSLADNEHNFYKTPLRERITFDLPAKVKMLSQSPGEVMVVQAEISPQAIQQGAFNELLRKNHIALETSTDSGALKSDNLSSFKENADLASERDTDIVYVEASPEQIQNMLSDLQKEPQLFSAVSVSTGKTDGAAALGAYTPQQQYGQMSVPAQKDAAKERPARIAAQEAPASPQLTGQIEAGQQQNASSQSAASTVVESRSQENFALRRADTNGQQAGRAVRLSPQLFADDTTSDKQNSESEKLEVSDAKKTAALDAGRNGTALGGRFGGAGGFGGGGFRDDKSDAAAKYANHVSSDAIQSKPAGAPPAPVLAPATAAPMTATPPAAAPMSMAFPAGVTNESTTPVANSQRALFIFRTGNAASPTPANPPAGK